MSEADELAWAEQLQSRYGITEPVAEEQSHYEVVRTWLDTEGQRTGRDLLGIDE